MELQVSWLGRLDYRTAWDRQHRLVAARAAGEIPDQLLLLEHGPVLTLGRRSDEGHVRVPAEALAARGMELIRVERGGEVTYHGPGQLVAYPIVDLTARGILIRSYVRALEAAMIEVSRTYGVAADRREGYPGCWCAADSLQPRKLGALGVRVERGVAYHGIALNVTTELRDFELIDPCGLPGLIPTSIAREAGWPPGPPTTESVHQAGLRFASALAETLAEAPAAPRPDRLASGTTVGT